ncbi:phosphatidate cytidylyltransferase [Paludibacter sp.]
MSNFWKRTLSGFFFVFIILGSVLLSPYTFAILFLIISASTIHEFHKLTNKQSEVEVISWLAIVGSVILFLTSFFFASGKIKYPSYSVYGLFVVLVLVLELYRKKNHPIHNWAYFVLGQIIIAVPFSLLNYIYYMHGFNVTLLIAMFVTIWLNDTGAYLVGVSIGKHKMFERISPKKSWEGFIGGAVTALVTGYVFSLFFPQISLLSWLIFSEIVVVFGTFGDLLESLMKRAIKVKDSGDVIPGHGGLLDRFDSMLLAAPAIFIYLSFLLK